MTYLDPKIWGPPYWFFLHTISITYPHYPSAVTKKKYYDLIQNFSLFLPNEKISNEFSELLHEYPITPYLDNRESFVRWVWFVHNKINEKLEVQKITLEDFYKKYYENYKPKEVKFIEFYKMRSKLVYFAIVLLLFVFIYFYHNK